jgi:hypothetical protein
VLADGPKNVFYAAEGRFATYPLSEEGPSGPLQLWDAATGNEIDRFLGGERAFQAHAHSEDGRYFVALARGGKQGTTRICGVDLREQREWQVEAAVGEFQSAIVAARCNFATLLLPAAKGDAEYLAIVETSSGRIVDRFAAPDAADDHGHFAADGGCFVIGYRDEEENKNHIRTVSTRTGKTTVIADGRFIAVSPDSRWLIADRGEAGVWVWDMAASAWHGPLEGVMVREGWRFKAPAIEGGVKYLVQLSGAKVRQGVAAVRLWEQSGRAVRGLWRLDQGDGLVFSPDSRFVLWIGSHWGGEVAVYHVHDRDRLWQWSSSESGDLSFTPDSRRIVATLPDQVRVVDAATAATQLTIPLPWSADLQRRLTQDGRTLLVAQTPAEGSEPRLWRQILDWLAPRRDSTPVVIHAFDLDAGAPLGCLQTEEPDEYWLTDDRANLLTVHNEHSDSRVIETTIRCWDMPPGKPLRWAVGVPLALGTLLVSLRAGWHRLRRRTASTKPVPGPEATPS